MNKVILTGRITKDLELRATSSGINIITYQLAVRRDKDTTDFINITTFGDFAKTLHQYCHKGDMIVIEGRLQINTYTDKDGNNKSSYSVVSEKIDFLNTKKGDESKSTPSVQSIKQDEIELDDSELPF